MKGDHLGELEELVLLAVCSLSGDAYGVSVQQEIENSTGRDCTLGSVYSALDRLERKDCLTSRLGGRTSAAGGRRKRIFEATARGRRRLEETRAAREALWRRVRSNDA
jgi:DNA-binding PadR family transcriptional regulator